MELKNKMTALVGDDHVWMTTKEVSRYFKLSTSFFEKLRCFGRGPAFYKLNGKILYRLADLIAWAETNRQQGGGSNNG